MRAHGKPLVPRVFVGLLVLMCASSFATASDSPRAHDRVHRTRPSNFDYLVLASIADSPHVLTMAGYRPEAGSRKMSARSGKPNRQLAED
jgi:hypothetical protein